MMPMFWVRWIKHTLVRSDYGIFRVKMMPKRLKALSGVVGGGWWVLFMCMQASVVKRRISTACILFTFLWVCAIWWILCDNGQLHIHVTLLKFFEKIAHMSVVWAYVSLWLCGFVCSDVCCRDQQGWRYNEFMQGINEILAFKHDIA